MGSGGVIIAEAIIKINPAINNVDIFMIYLSKLCSGETFSDS